MGTSLTGINHGQNDILKRSRQQIPQWEGWLSVIWNSRTSNINKNGIFAWLLCKEKKFMLHTNSFFEKRNCHSVGCGRTSASYLIIRKKYFPYHKSEMEHNAAAYKIFEKRNCQTLLGAAWSLYCASVQHLTPAP